VGKKLVAELTADEGEGKDNPAAAKNGEQQFARASQKFVYSFQT